MLVSYSLFDIGQLRLALIRTTDQERSATRRQIKTDVLKTIGTVLELVRKVLDRNGRGGRCHGGI